uniref:Cyclic nucleotide-binding domain-containing protein n=1 Tax=Phytophthora ramorum TaxID=164328 RepID=H3GRK7_PHYRM
MILVDEPALRNEQSLDLVYSWMLQNCKQYSNNIFGSAPEYIRREICRQMRLIKVKSGGLVIRQGDTGDRCYIVVDGLVDVYVKMEKAVDVVVTPVSPPPMLSTTKQRRMSSEDYLYRAGTDAKWMYIVTAGEVMERINWTLEAAGNDAAMRRLLFSQPSSRKNPEKIVNVELTLIGPGDIAGELPFVTSKRSAIFDIKAATDVQALAIDRRYYETVMLTATRDNKPEVYATVKKLRKFSQDREDWRQQRMECGISYPSAHVNMYYLAFDEDVKCYMS